MRLMCRQWAAGSFLAEPLLDLWIVILVCYGRFCPRRGDAALGLGIMRERFAGGRVVVDVSLNI